MSDVVYRANLKAASFPFLSELFGRSIIVKGPDQTSPIGKSEPGTTDTANQGTPQIYYCHNVLPTDNGYKSIGYTTVTAATGSTFSKVIGIHDSTGASANLAVTSSGVLYVMQYGSTVWTAVGTPPVAATIAGKRMTVGFVAGVSYIYFEGVGGYTYDFTTNNMTATAFTWDAPLTDADILGLTSNRGYLIAYTTDSVLWSSLVDPTDFVASLATGAGGGLLEGARGIIVTIESVYGGFLIFTNGNTVSAIASDNTRFPYNFMEVVGAGGLLDPEFVSYDANSNSVYSYTTAGMQQVSVKGATVVFPEVTDFLSGGLLEDYNETTNVLTLTDTAGVVLQKRLVVIASRYVVISYGISSLTNALVYDSGYKQWGRLKIDHVDCFEFDRQSVETPRKSLSFLGSDGSIKTVNMDILNSSANGVMLLGKMQYVRTRLLQLQRVAFENVNTGDSFTLLDLPAADGKNFGNALSGYLAVSSGKYREYLFHNTALNHTLVFKGSFNAVCVVLTFNVTGAR